MVFEVNIVVLGSPVAKITYHFGKTIGCEYRFRVPQTELLGREI